MIAQFSFDFGACYLCAYYIIKCKIDILNSMNNCFIMLLTDSTLVHSKFLISIYQIHSDDRVRIVSEV